MSPNSQRGGWTATWLSTWISTWTDWRRRLFEPVDIASIVLFRICFGAVIFWEVWRFFDHDWIRKYYIARAFYFKYYGFEWVHPWPGDGMYYHFLGVGLLGLCVMTGLYYRLTSWLLFLAFSYWFLLDQTRYLNHLYMAVLVTFMMACIPAHRAKSFDVLRRPAIRSETLPFWCLVLLRAQVGIVYFYAGIAKLNGDWLQAQPIRLWLSRRHDMPIIGPWLDTDLAGWFFAYGGLIFDLAVAPALLWHRTRYWALAACVFFHTTNKVLFNIGIFPVMMLAATLLMLPPDWPRKLNLLFSPVRNRSASKSSSHGHSHAESGISERKKRCIVAGLAAYIGFQILFPLRHFLYPGTVHWTEEGHRFAWHMKLRQKRAQAQFLATDPATGETWEIDQREHLSSQQRRLVGRWPDMSLQFAHYLAEELRQEGHPDIEIRARSKASLNNRPYQDLIDPDVVLSEQPRNLWPADWILPLKEPPLEEPPLEEPPLEEP